ncbi:transglycosylase domain-containing protein [Nonomuraea sp. K274]|uniref:Transglycosylase domain-containing protein n=1 Tax=Nonomuraea cypriaca TaxID=1187855 RepID=A0A931A971_9ACTN|nr:transglycosylase domain-containing protein [Nonomuraea cypriaca]MBF8188697.1 transglycosylase domain-containing protein [Nonomuraea cypriaca]
MTVLRSIGVLGLTGALGGVLTAALIAPVASGGGIAAMGVTNMFVDLPPAPREEPLAQVTRLLDKDGRQFAQFYEANRTAVRLGAVAPVMRRAIVAIEDARFYEHGGLDVRGTFRALLTNTQAGGIKQGGSSLTQQLVKNILVESARTGVERDKARAPNLARKITELRLALALEKKYRKDEILERYLNIAYFGAGAHGVQAAARRFFSTSASKLTLTQAATLAGAVRMPYSTDPSLGGSHRARLKMRRDLVLDRMAGLKLITQQQAAAGKAAPLAIKLRPEPGGCEQSRYPFYCLYVQRELLSNPAFGNTDAERRARMARGGLVIRTSLDPAAQQAAERAISRHVAPEDTEVAAEAMVEPGTGRITAMAASKRFGRNPGNKKSGSRTTFNLPADVAHGGGQGFQAGSTFKVFTLATALKQGWRFNDGFETPGALVPGQGYRNCAGRSVNDPNTRVLNASGEGEGGPHSIETGTWKSVNIFYMMLERKVGLCDVVRTARALGAIRADGGPLREVPTFTLGVNEMDPVTVAASFAAFAARGQYCRPLAIVEITGRDGRRTHVPPACEQAIERQVADAVNHVLSGVFDKGTMQGQSIGRPAAGKTGTNNGYTSAWFAGYTPHLAAAVSVGDIRGSYRFPLQGVQIGDRYYGSVQGASLPGPIWVESMRSALRRFEPKGFPGPDMGRFGGGHTPGLEEAVVAEDRRKKRRGDRAFMRRHRRLFEWLLQQDMDGPSPGWRHSEDSPWGGSHGDRPADPYAERPGWDRRDVRLDDGPAWGRPDIPPIERPPVQRHPIEPPRWRRPDGPPMERPRLRPDGPPMDGPRWGRPAGPYPERPRRDRHGM